MQEDHTWHPTHLEAAIQQLIHGRVSPPRSFSSRSLSMKLEMLTCSKLNLEGGVSSSSCCNRQECKRLEYTKWSCKPQKPDLFCHNHSFNLFPEIPLNPFSPSRLFSARESIFTTPQSRLDKMWVALRRHFWCRVRVTSPSLPGIVACLQPSQ